jgi:nitrous oxidase accessory protein
MKKTVATLLILTLLTSLFIVLFFPVKAQSRMIVVPDDFSSIQSAIDNAEDGDTVFVKEGTYQERVLNINKSILVLGEDKDKTIINFDPPVVNYTFLYDILQAHAIAITIEANDAKFSGFTVNMPTDMNSLGGISATGDRIEIVSNNLGRECHIQLKGKSANISENKIPSVNLIGDNQTLMNNQVEGGLEAQGIFNRIVGNTIGDIVLTNCSFNLFFNNSIAWLNLWYCDSNFICNNTLDRMDMVTACFNNTVCKNRIIGPGLHGILVEGSYNVFHDNLISNFTNWEGHIIYGIFMSAAGNNIFYRNMLMDNDCHVSGNDWVKEGNTWDNGREGNYWDNYTGSDTDGDGIGEDPYLVGCKWDNQAKTLVSYVFGQDNHPLMAPFNIDDVKIDFPDWPSSHSESTPEAFPTTLLIVFLIAVVTVVGVGLLVYLKKRHPKTGDKSS